MNFYDYFVLLIITIIIFWSNRSGFVSVFYRLTSFVISVFIAINLYPYISAFYRITPLYSFFCKLCSDSTFNKLSSVVESKKIDFNQAVDKLEAPGFIKSSINSMFQGDEFQGNIASVSSKIGECFAKIIIDLFAIVTLFLIVFILMLVLKKILLTLVKLPILKSADKMFGTVLGIVFSLALVYVLSGFITIISGVFSLSDVKNVLNESLLYPIFIKHNFLISLFV